METGEKHFKGFNAILLSHVKWQNFDFHNPHQSLCFYVIAVVTTSAISQNYVSLLFKDGSKQYVVTAEGDSGNVHIKAVVSNFI